MIPNAILIHGRKGVGKDTLGHHLYLRYGYFQTALADILKLFLEESNPPLVINQQETRLTDVLRKSGSWDAAKRDHHQIRQLLTSLGQGARNTFGDDFWVRRYIQKMDDFRAEFPHIGLHVVTDVRYENELTHLKDYFGPGARSVKLLRPGHDADGHPSEDGLPDHLFDMVLENNSSPAALFQKMELTLGIWETEIADRIAA